jgi:hypothetical protein
MNQYTIALSIFLLPSFLLAQEQIKSISESKHTIEKSASSSFDSDFEKNFNTDLNRLKNNPKDSQIQHQLNKRNFDCATGVYGSSNCSYTPNNRFGNSGSVSYSSSRTVTTSTTTTTTKSADGSPSSTTTTTKTSSSYSNFPNRDNNARDNQMMDNIKAMEKEIMRANQK